MSKFYWVPVYLAVLCFGCTRNSLPAANTPPLPGVSSGNNYKLSSGRDIKITSMNRMTFQNGQTALVLNYETETPIEDKKALRAEAEEVWEKFRHDVEGANLPAGILRPVYMKDSGMFVKNGKGYGFVIERGADGQWRWLDDEK